MTVRLSSFCVSAFVGLAVGIATALPLAAPREFDRVVRSARGGSQRLDSCEVAQGHVDDHGEPAVVVSTPAACAAGGHPPATSGALVEVSGPRLDPRRPIGLNAGIAGPPRLPGRRWLAPTGRAPPDA